MIKSIRMIGMSALAAGLGLLVTPLARAQDTVFISSTGNVGIGTSSPVDKLHLFNSTDVPTVLRIESTSSGANAVSNFRAQSNTAVAHFRAHGSGRTINHFGVVLGGWSELVQDIGNGLLIGTQNATPIILGTNNTNRLQIDGSTGAVTIAGNVGIGTANPTTRLEVSGGEVRFPPGANGVGFTVFNFSVNAKNYIRGTTIIADNGGSVGIGTPTPSSLLHVNGGDIRVSGGSFIDDGVTLNAPDYVFESNYKLMPLEELREFVTQEKHLPNVPNGREVKEKGLNLSQFQMRLLEKVEELTLYALSQQEQIGSLHKENSKLKERLEALEGTLQQH